MRENGVTLHMALHSDRQPIPDVPAVYFLEPTADNIRRVAQDLASGLYETFHLNFSSAIPRPLLEELAAASSQHAHLVAQVYDQYLNFVSLESNLFTQQQSNAYVILNDPKTTERVMEGLLDQIANALFSVLVTMSILKSPTHMPRGGSNH